MIFCGKSSPGSPNNQAVLTIASAGAADATTAAVSPEPAAPAKQAAPISSSQTGDPDDWRIQPETTRETPVHAKTIIVEKTAIRRLFRLR